MLEQLAHWRGLFVTIYGFDVRDMLQRFSLFAFVAE